MVGLTWTEVLVALAIVTTLFLAYWMAMSKYMHGSQMTVTLSNLKRIHLAAGSMAKDGMEMEDPLLGWPEDTGGTYTNWVRKAVPAYLGTNDFCKLLSAPGKAVGKSPFPLESSRSAVLIYAVISNSAGDTVFLSTANFTNSSGGGLSLRRDARPYGNGGFVVFRKNGVGAILPARKAGDPKVVGSYVPMLK